MGRDKSAARATMKEIYMDGQDSQDEERADGRFEVSNLKSQISYPDHPVHPC
jgi:hypothetical protein